MNEQLTWAEWLALLLLAVFVLVPLTVCRWLAAVWLRVTGRWVREERRRSTDSVADSRTGTDGLTG